MPAWGEDEARLLHEARRLYKHSEGQCAQVLQGLGYRGASQAAVSRLERQVVKRPRLRTVIALRGYIDRAPSQDTATDVLAVSTSAARRRPQAYLRSPPGVERLDLPDARDSGTELQLLRDQLERERTGRAVAETRIAELEGHLRRANQAINALQVNLDASPDLFESRHPPT